MACRIDRSSTHHLRPRRPQGNMNPRRSQSARGATPAAGCDPRMRSMPRSTAISISTFIRDIAAPVICAARRIRRRGAYVGPARDPNSSPKPRPTRARSTRVGRPRHPKTCLRTLQDDGRGEFGHVPVSGRRAWDTAGRRPCQALFSPCRSRSKTHQGPASCAR